MKIIKNLIGSFSLFIISILLISCSRKIDYSEIGNKIISENKNIIFDSLSIFDINIKHNVEINEVINKDSSIFYNYNLTMIDSSFVKRLGVKKFSIENVKNFNLTLPKSFVIGNRQFSISDTRPLGKVITIEIFNFYIDQKYNEVFFMTRKGIKGGIGNKTDIYHFRKINNNWRFVRKSVVSIG